MDVEWGVRAWRQYAKDTQVWKEEYKRLALETARRLRWSTSCLPAQYPLKSPRGDLTANDWN